MLRALVNERLNAAVEEIFELFERTLVEYEEELCRSKDVIERQRQLLDAREPSGGVGATGCHIYSSHVLASTLVVSVIIL